jgi:hypothetical protein
MATTGLAHPENAHRARPESLDGLVDTLGLGDQDPDACTLEGGHRAAADAGAENGLNAAALEGSGRVAVPLSVGGVGQDRHLAALGVHQGEKRRATQMTGHRSLEPFVSVGRDADPHCLVLL